MQFDENYDSQEGSLKDMDAESDKHSQILGSPTPRKIKKDNSAEGK